MSTIRRASGRTVPVAVRAAVLAGSVVLALTSCGSDGDPEDGGGGEAAGDESAAPGTVGVAFSLEFSPTGYHAPYALALEKGWFSDAGLDVTMTAGTGSSATITTVAGGQADVGLADLATLVITKDADMPVTAFGVMFAEAPTAVAVHEDAGVEEPADLDGMSIAITTGGLDAQLLPAFLESNGLDGKVEAVNVSSSAKTGAFLAHRVDGFVPVLCGTAVVVEEQEGAPLTTLPFGDYGVDMMGLGLIANDSFMAENPDALRAFLEVSDQAWTYAEEHPDEAVAAMTAQFPEIQEETARGQLDCAFDFVHGDDTQGEPFGTMSPEKWDSMLATLSQYADVEPLASEEYYTSEYEVQ